MLGLPDRDQPVRHALRVADPLDGEYIVARRGAGGVRRARAARRPRSRAPRDTARPATARRGGRHPLARHPAARSSTRASIVSARSSREHRERARRSSARGLRVPASNASSPARTWNQARCCADVSNCASARRSRARSARAPARDVRLPRRAARAVSVERRSAAIRPRDAARAPDVAELERRAEASSRRPSRGRRVAIARASRDRGRRFAEAVQREERARQRDLAGDVAVRLRGERARLRAPRAARRRDRRARDSAAGIGREHARREHVAAARRRALPERDLLVAPRQSGLTGDGASAGRPPGRAAVAPRYAGQAASATSAPAAMADDRREPQLNAAVRSTGRPPAALSSRSSADVLLAEAGRSLPSSAARRARQRVAERRAERDLDHVVRDSASAERAAGRTAGLDAEVRGVPVLRGSPRTRRDRGRLQRRGVRRVASGGRRGDRSDLLLERRRGDAAAARARSCWYLVVVEVLERFFDGRAREQLDLVVLRRTAVPVLRREPRSSRRCSSTCRARRVHRGEADDGLRMTSPYVPLTVLMVAQRWMVCEPEAGREQRARHLDDEGEHVERVAESASAGVPGHAGREGSRRGGELERERRLGRRAPAVW